MRIQIIQSDNLPNLETATNNAIEALEAAGKQILLVTVNSQTLVAVIQFV